MLQVEKALDISVKDRRGRNATALAEAKEHYDVVAAIKEYLDQVCFCIDVRLLFGCFSADLAPFCIDVRLFFSCFFGCFWADLALF